MFIRRSYLVAAAQSRAGLFVVDIDFDGTFELIDGEDLAWPFALPLSLPRIEEFASKWLFD